MTAGQLGLPASAWQNGKSFAATSFPGNPVVGDRIYRSDQGIWYTYTSQLVGSTLTGFWHPDAGSFVCEIEMTTFVTVPDSTATKMTNMSYARRNLNSYWDTSNSKFLPLIPGYYLLGGGVGWDSTTTAGSQRRAWFKKNGSTDVNSSGFASFPVTFTTSTMVRDTPTYFNGSTDYVELYAFQVGGAGASGVRAYGFGAAGDVYSTNFWATYLNPVP